MLTYNNNRIRNAHLCVMSYERSKRNNHRNNHRNVIEILNDKTVLWIMIYLVLYFHFRFSFAVVSILYFQKFLACVSFVVFVCIVHVYAFRFIPIKPNRWYHINVLQWWKCNRESSASIMTASHRNYLALMCSNAGS